MAGAKDTAVVRVAKLRYWRATDACVVVEAWRRSGDTVPEFARRYGIHPRRLGRWAGQLKAPPGPGESEASVLFHPVRLVQQADGARDRRRDGEPIEIVLDEGCSVRVPPGFAVRDLERVLAVLAQGVRC
jgi:hypothetical protein